MHMQLPRHFQMIIAITIHELHANNMQIQQIWPAGSDQLRQIAGILLGIIAQLSSRRDKILILNIYLLNMRQHHT